MYRLTRILCVMGITIASATESKQAIQTIITLMKTWGSQGSQLAHARTPKARVTKALVVSNEYIHQINKKKICIWIVEKLTG